MPVQEAEKQDLTDVKSQPMEAKQETSKRPSAEAYDDGLHERFMLWKDQAGHTYSHIARMINRSTAAVSNYVNKVFAGDLAVFEKDIANLLRREEELEFTSVPRVFCKTLASRLIWEVFQFCDENCDMGVAVGPAGSGKTITCNEYKRVNRNTVFVTADIATRSVGSVLRMIAKRVGGTPYGAGSNSALLHAIIDKLKQSNRLIIIDEAHFLTWEAFEVIRKIHDCAGVGVVYVGMERLYDQMKGTSGRNFLFEQIYSRISIKRDDLPVEREDVKALADSLRPGLDKECIDFLHKKAQGTGKFRTVTKLLQVAGSMERDYGQAMGLELLRSAETFLLKG
jgi:hypothetical protein